MGLMVGAVDDGLINVCINPVLAGDYLQSEDAFNYLTDPLNRPGGLLSGRYIYGYRSPHAGLAGDSNTRIAMGFTCILTSMSSARLRVASMRLSGMAHMVGNDEVPRL
jgi:hypothetical protein